MKGGAVDTVDTTVARGVRSLGVNRQAAVFDDVGVVVAVVIPAVEGGSLILRPHTHLTLRDEQEHVRGRLPRSAAAAPRSGDAASGNKREQPRHALLHLLVMIAALVAYDYGGSRNPYTVYTHAYQGTSKTNYDKDPARTIAWMRWQVLRKPLFVKNTIKL